ncbi:thiolase C-terminal domain-containing protein [Dactylosporangium sp. CS-047395]|uniref:thiolase C-terminal domain-containing protein n=1 Tax=Dactylosporangium sp. CS-047395 TaxID=3239936 RepID=UPI003D90A910
MARAAAIVGIYEHPERLCPNHSAMQLQAIAARGALRDAGLGPSDVDALFDALDGGLSSRLAMAEYLGLRPYVIDTTMVGGASFEFHVAHARNAILAGKCDVALLTYGAVNRSAAKRIGTGAPPSYGGENAAENMEAPWGTTLIANYAMVAMRHMHQYGTTEAQLAEIAVATRAHAVRNPDAVAAMKALKFAGTGELTVADVLASPVVADPLHKFECCMVSDGAGAIVLAADHVAAGTRRPPVWVLGTGEAVRYTTNDGDLTRTAAAQSGPAAFAEAGVTPSDVDIAMIYDSFTVTVLTVLEDLGFCAKGEGGAYVEGGRLRFDRPGGPALNTDGGGLFSNHPGMRGIFLLIEAVRQLRGESTAQVPGASLAVAHGNGGMLASRHAGGTVVLGKERG